MSEGYLSQEDYDVVVASVPIVCADVIPVDWSDRSTGTRFGVITRATGPEAGKLAIVGGRIKKDETISAAIGQHLFDSLGSDEFEYFAGNEETRPFYVAQYEHAATSTTGYDPTKHAIALTYLIEIPEPVNVGGEAVDFRWINAEEIPNTSAYNHHLTLQRAAKFVVSAGRD